MEIFLIVSSIREAIHRLQLPLPELPEFSRRHHFEGIEISDRDVAGQNESALEDLADACTRMDCGIVLDVGCDLTLASEKALKRQIEHAKTMTRMAKHLKARGIRIWLGGQRVSIQRLLFCGKPSDPAQAEAPCLGKTAMPSFKKGISSMKVTGIAHRIRELLPSRIPGVEAKIARAVSSLKQIVEDQAAESLFFAVENHWGISARPETLLTVLSKTGSSRVGTCPDFANFPRDVNRYEALRQLAPRAFLAHAKRNLRGDPVERDVDFRRCLTILKESNFDGIIAVEHDGPGDALGDCLTMKRMIRDFW